MNENLSLLIKKRVTLACCNEDKKCELCKPEWQRTLMLDDNFDLWFPVTGMTNVVLEKLSKTDLGFLVEHATGVWYVHQALALEVAQDEKEASAIQEICNVIISKCKEELEEKSEVDEIQ